MESQRLIRFVLLGSHELEEYAILIVRVALGLFFAISGANKLFVPQQTQVMYETLVAANVPLPRLMVYFVSSVEFVGGLMLIAGFLSSLACLALLGDMLVAILTTEAGRTAQRGFAPELAGQLSLPSGSSVRTLLRLVDLFRSRQIQHRSPDRC